MREVGQGQSFPHSGLGLAQGGPSPAVKPVSTSRSTGGFPPAVPVHSGQVLQGPLPVDPVVEPRPAVPVHSGQVLQVPLTSSRRAHGRYPQYLFILVRYFRAAILKNVVGHGCPQYLFILVRYFRHTGWVQQGELPPPAVPVHSGQVLQGCGSRGRGIRIARPAVPVHSGQVLQGPWA